MLTKLLPNDSVMAMPKLLLSTTWGFSLLLNNLSVYTLKHREVFFYFRTTIYATMCTYPYTKNIILYFKREGGGGHNKSKHYRLMRSKPNLFVPLTIFIIHSNIGIPIPLFI